MEKITLKDKIAEYQRDRNYYAREERKFRKHNDKKGADIWELKKICMARIIYELKQLL